MNLFKRNSKGEIHPGDAGYKDASYTVRFDVGGKSILRSTKCTVKDEAEKAANRIYDEELKKSLGVAPVKATPALPVLVLPTIDQLIAAYMIAPTVAKTGTRQQNAAALRQLLQVANPTCENVGQSLRIDSINEAAAGAWFNRTHASNAAIEGDQVTVLHNKNTANANFGKIASMFHDGLLDHYKSVGLYCACMEEFRKKGKARKFKKVSRGINPYNPPHQKIVDAVLADWLKIEDRNVFIAAGFALSFGFRKGETLQVKWGYLQPLHGGCPGLSGGAEVKNGSGWLEARALDPYYTQMMARLEKKGWRGADNELILQGGVAELETLLWDRLSKWLVSLGWTTDKKSHALRAYSGSKVYQRYGLTAAKLYLHHAKADTTEQHYSHFASKWPMDDDERMAMPERWAAKVATNVVPMIRIAA